MASTWEEKASKKRSDTLAAIPAKWRLSSIPTAEEQKDVTKFIRGTLTPEEIEITETDAEAIVAKTSTGQWTAESVTLAFCHRAALAHQLLNCLHEIFFDAAISSARALDAHFATHKTPIGPLHGLPISLKDQFHVRDVETTMGYVGWIGTFQGVQGTGKERVHESEMVRSLRDLGAVLYVKTAVPHTLMCGETANNIIEYTWNPANRLVSAGGSSGGEGALIAARGSPVGFGSDIGGSVRIPAAFNGLFGLKPSMGRLPYEGVANSMDGQNTVLSVLGPLGSTIGALRLVTKALLGTKPWLYDPLVNEMPWVDELDKDVRGRKLVFGVCKGDGYVALHPPVQRAIDLVEEKLKKAGHEVIEWKPPSHLEVYALAQRAWQLDGGLDVTSAFALSGETPYTLLATALGPAPGPQANATQIAALNVEKREMQKRYMDYWNSTSSLTQSGLAVDAIVTPLAPFAAARPKSYKWYGYSAWVNAMDYTSVTVPVTKADKGVDGRVEGYEALNEVDREIWETYDPEIFDGTPVSIQVVGRRLQEEKTLAVAERVAESLK